MTSEIDQKIDRSWHGSDESDGEREIVLGPPPRSRHTSIRDIAIEQLSQFHYDDYDDVECDAEKPAVPVVKKRPMLQVKVFSGDFDNEAAQQTVKTPSVKVSRSETGELILGKFHVSENGLVVMDNDDDPSKSGSRRKVSITSRTDFAEVRTLGTGTHGIVVEALHIPSMTLVAIKMLSINTEDHLQSVNSELHVSCLTPPSFFVQTTRSLIYQYMY